VAGTEDQLFYDKLVASYIGARDYVNRDWLEQEVLERLANPDCRYVLITGEPGAGKTGLIAALARDHPGAPRYFLRRDSTTPMSGGDAVSLLLRVGHQLAARRPEIFAPDRLQVIIEQRVGRAGPDATIVGARIEDVRVSPFQRTAIRVAQEVGELAGDVVGLWIERAEVEPRLLEPEVLQYLALLDPAAADPDTPITVLIDALDEVARYRGGLSVLDWLVTGPELPPNVRLVLTSRPGPSLDALRAARAGSIEEISIAATSHEVRADVRTFTSRLFADPALGVDDPGDAAEQVALKADGNFAYLTAYARALRSAATQGNEDSLRALLRLDTLPTGLDALYGHFLALLRRDIDQLGALEADPATGAGWMPAWEGAGQRLLGVLTVARASLTLDQLMTFGTVPVRRRDAANVLERLVPFLDADGRTWQLFHSSLAQFLATDVVDQAEWHRRIIGHYRGSAASWGEVDWAEADDYGLLHLAEHLIAVDDLDGLSSLATDPARHDQMLHRMGGDAAAAAEIETAQEHLAHEPERHLSALALLAAERERLSGRNFHVPPELPSLWAGLGDANKAEALAESLPGLYAQVGSLVRVAGVLAHADPGRAGRVADRAETLARGAPKPYRQTPESLVVSQDHTADWNQLSDLAYDIARLAQIMAAIDPARTYRLADYAEHLAGGLTEEHWAGQGWRAVCIAGIARSLVDGNADAVEEMAHSLADGNAQAVALCDIAEALAETDADRASRIVGEIQMQVPGIADAYQRAELMSRTALVLDALGDDRAREVASRAADLARELAGSCIRAFRLFNISSMLLSSGNIFGGTDEEQVHELAEVLVQHAEDLSDNLQGFSQQIEMLADFTTGLAILDVQQAEAVARGLGNLVARAVALAGVARKVAAADSGHARGIAEVSEDLARNTADPYELAAVLSCIASVLVEADPGRAHRLATDAEALGRQSPGLTQRGAVLASAARTLADVSADSADDLIRGLDAIDEELTGLMQHGWSPTVPGVRDVAEKAARSLYQDDPYGRSVILAAAAQGFYDTDPERARRLAVQAEEAAREINHPYRRATMLAGIAAVLLADADIGKAEILARDAVGLARHLTDLYEEASVLADAAIVLTVADHPAARDLAREAEEVARDLSNPRHRAAVLTRLTPSLAGTDPDPAPELPGPDCWPAVDKTVDALSEAVGATLTYHSARQSPGSGDDRETDDDDAGGYEMAAIADGMSQRLAWIIGLLADAMYVLTKHDPAATAELTRSAEQLTANITDSGWRVKALTSLAAAIADGDPSLATRALEEAETLARSTAERTSQADALVTVAFAIAGIDTDRARRLGEEVESLVRDVTHPFWGSHPLLYLARALAHADPDRAVAIARTLTDKEQQAILLTDIAQTLAPADSNRAIRLVVDADKIMRETTDRSSITEPQEHLARVLAKIDLGAAEALARSIADPGWRAIALSGIGCAIAHTDPDYARYLANEADATRSGKTDFFSVSRSVTASELARIAHALADRDIAQGEAQASALVSQPTHLHQFGSHWWAETLIDIGTMLAKADPGRAERLSDLVMHDSYRQTYDRTELHRVLAGIARALAGTHPGRAQRHAAQLLRTPFWYAVLPAIGELRPEAVIALADYWSAWRTPLPSA
jgi:hypothetical protein